MLGALLRCTYFLPECRRKKGKWGEKHDSSAISAPKQSISNDPDFLSNEESTQQHKITQCELNDLVRDLQLPNSKAELMAS